jgi:hypothetical protein
MASATDYAHQFNPGFVLDSRTVALVVGPPIEVPEDAGETAIEAKRVEHEQARQTADRVRRDGQFRSFREAVEHADSSGGRNS